MLLGELEEVFGASGPRVVQVVIVDDGSTDRTVEVARGYVASTFELKVFQMPWAQGKASALGHAIRHALSSDIDAILMMDGDCQDDPAFIPKFLEPLGQGIDVVNGRRVNRAHKLPKRLSSKAFNFLVRSVTRIQFADINSGFKAFSRRGAVTLSPYLYGELHRTLLVIAVRLGLSVSEVRVVNRPRHSGSSKYGVARSWRGLLDLLAVQFLLRYQGRPGHFFAGFGFSLLVAGVAYGAVFGLSGLNAVFFGLFVISGVLTIGLGFLAELMVFLTRTNPEAVSVRGNLIHRPDST